MNIIEDKSFAVLRIIFGLVWAIDAYFKWQPSFLNNFTSYLIAGAQGQSLFVQDWINLWVNGVSVNPYFFGILVAVTETIIAASLIFGLFTEIAIIGGVAMALVIWSTAEGFGGPYIAGSTDIGAAIIYVLLFISLWLGRCWRYYSIDSLLKSKKILRFLYWRW